MIIDDLDLICIAVTPLEADSPLVVDANAVLAGAIPYQLLEVVPWRNAKVFQCLGSVQKQQFPQSGSLEKAGQLLDGETLKQAFGLLVAKTANHRAR